MKPCAYMYRLYTGAMADWLPPVKCVGSAALASYSIRVYRATCAPGIHVSLSTDERFQCLDLSCFLAVPLLRAENLRWCGSPGAMHCQWSRLGAVLCAFEGHTVDQHAYGITMGPAAAVG